jgi:hypothetical protein
LHGSSGRRCRTTGHGLAVTTPLTLKIINSEPAKRGHKVRLERGSGYFYFWTGEATDWLEKTVRVPRVGSLRLEQWIREFRRLMPRSRNVPVSRLPLRDDPIDFQREYREHAA